MSRLWVLPVLGLIAVVAMACSGGEEAVSSVSSSNSPTASTQSPTISSSTPKPSATPAGTAPAGVTNTYTNSKYGYSFEYPAHWLIDDPPTSDPATSDYVSLYASIPASHGEKIEFVILDNVDGAPLEQWIASYLAASPFHPEIKSTEAVSASNAAGIRQILSAEGVTAYAAYFSLPGKVLLVNGPWVDSSIIEDYEKVIESLRLRQ